MTSSELDQADYTALGQLMAGPHGVPVTMEDPVSLLIVFSCADPEVGHTAAHLYHAQLVKQVIFSGNVGKDSAGLPALGITEAAFLASVAIAEGLPAETILLEQKATNGKENAAFSLRLAHDLGLLTPRVHIASLAPAQRSRRLYEELRYQAETSFPGLAAISGLSSGALEVGDSAVRKELVRELNGLHIMHREDIGRIFKQIDLQPGGMSYDLVERAGLAN